MTCAGKYLKAAPTKLWISMLFAALMHLADDFTNAVGTRHIVQGIGLGICHPFSLLIKLFIWAASNMLSTEH